MDEPDWRLFVTVHHQAHPGVTEHLFALADTSPYAWLAEPLHGARGTTLDPACGSALTRDELSDADWVGTDLSAAELVEAARRGLGPLVRAGADALPAASASVGGVCAAMCLPVATPLPQVLGEIRRVLRPGGTLAALVPSQSGLSSSGLLGWLRVMVALRAVRQPWPGPQARDGLAALLGAAGFHVRCDERRVFTLAIDSADAAALLADALSLPGLTHHRAQAAKCSLARWAASGRRLELPLRRVVADLLAQQPSPEPI